MLCVRFFLALLVATLTASQPAAGQIPDLKTGGSVPTLAPLVRQVTPAVVNISVHSQAPIASFAEPKAGAIRGRMGGCPL